MSSIAALLLALVLAVATFTDLRGRIVPNWLTLGGALAGLALAFPGGPGEVLLTLGAGLVLAAPLMVVAVLRPDGMGMGDVKLVAVIGIFLGWQAWPALLSGLLLAAAVGASLSVLTRRRPSGIALPLAPFLALGSLPVLAASL